MVGSPVVGNCVALSIIQTEASVVIGLVASKSGQGAIYQGVTTGGKWTAVEAESHINFLELMEAFLALQPFTKDLSSNGVLVQMDNWTAIAKMKNTGGPLCHLHVALEIWDSVRLTASPHMHLPGVDNISADCDTMWTAATGSSYHPCFRH